MEGHCSTGQSLQLAVLPMEEEEEEEEEEEVQYLTFLNTIAVPAYDKTTKEKICVE